MELSFILLVLLVTTRAFDAVTDLGKFLTMLFAGIEMQPSKIVEYSKQSLAVALGGLVLPMILGVALRLMFLPASDFLTAQALFIGTTLANLFSAVVIMAIITTVATPILLKRIYAR